MSNEAYIRSVALEKALEWKGDADLDPLAVLETAEKFRAFLAGEDTKPEPSKAKSEYEYFKYNAPITKIYYRSRVGTYAFGPGSLERLGYRGGELGWIPSTTAGNPKTYGEIVSRSREYKKIPAYEVPKEYR